MSVVLLNILQWILGIVLFLVLLILVLLIIVLLVPIRYWAEGEMVENKFGVRGEITWFLYLIYVRFGYEKEFQIQVRIFGITVFQNGSNIEKKSKKKFEKKSVKKSKTSVQEKMVSDGGNRELNEDFFKDSKAVGKERIPEEATEKSTEALFEESREEVKGSKAVRKEGMTKESAEALFEKSKEEVKGSKTVRKEGMSEESTEAVFEKSREESKKELPKEAKEKANKKLSDDSKGKTNEELLKDTKERLDNCNKRTEFEKNNKQREKKKFADFIKGIRKKIQIFVKKIKDVINAFKDRKLKLDHYLEIWNRKETQIAFREAKKRLGKMLKAILPKRWRVSGVVGFDDPCTTGQFMGVLGGCYPFHAGRVQIIPNFEKKIMNVEGSIKGHIRLGNLLYQIVVFILNRQCMKFIKLVFEELESSKKKKEI